MGTCWPEKPSNEKEKMVKELVQGQEFANQLQVVLQRPYGDEGSKLSAHELMFKILSSFTESISMLTSSKSVVVTEVCQNLESSLGDSACRDYRRSEDCGESRKRPAQKDRRGCYKRKNGSHSWTTVSPAIEDGQSWRKYGQKTILNAKHPRNYFRCTRKYDQGCKAMRQIQKMDENPEMYQITYIGHHTCRDILNSPQIVTDSDPWECHNNMARSNPRIHSQQNHGFHFHGSSTASTSVKQQESKEESPSDLTDNVSSMDSLMWKDLITPFESADGPALIRSHYGAAGSTAYSCSEATSESLDMDFMAKSVDFDSEFNFDDTGLLF